MAIMENGISGKPHYLGKLQIWCADCGKYQGYEDGEFNYFCKECRKPTTLMRCTRCNYEWAIKNANKMPLRCSKCNSIYYNRARVREQREEEFMQ